MFDINKATDLEIAEMMDICLTKLNQEQINIIVLRQEIQARKPKLSPPAEQPKE